MGQDRKNGSGGNGEEETEGGRREGDEKEKREVMEGRSPSLLQHLTTGTGYAYYMVSVVVAHHKLCTIGHNEQGQIVNTTRFADNQ